MLAVAPILLPGLCRAQTPAGSTITTVAGNGTAGYSGDTNPATDAQLSAPLGVAVDSSGHLYIADQFNNRIRAVAADGTITTVAGNGTAGYGGDKGPATSAQFTNPVGVAVDSSGNLYIAAPANNVIRKVAGGTITTLAGNAATGGYGGDKGPASIALLNQPTGLAVDTAGNLYIADTGNHRIRMITTNGNITTVAGNGGNGSTGDRGLAINAQLNGPRGVAVDAAGNLYIADTGNNRIRVVVNGIINTVAGNGTGGSLGDKGPATSAQLNRPTGVAVDRVGNIYIADFTNSRIRLVSTNGTISTVAGNGRFGYTGDGGPGTSATLNFPSAVAVDSAGNLYIADNQNNVIRFLQNPLPTFSSLEIHASWLAPNQAAGVAPVIGDTFQYQVAIKNNGNLPAGSVVVTDSPYSLPELSLQPPDGWTWDGGTGTFVVGTLAPGESRTLTLPAVAAAAGAYANAVQVTWTDSSGQAGSASDSTTAQVNPRASDVALTPLAAMPIRRGLRQITAEPGGNPFRPDSADVTLVAASDTSDALAVAGCANAVCTQGSGVVFPAGSKPIALAKADVNGDGLKDYLVLNQGTGTVAVLLAGSTPAPLLSPVGSQPSAFAVFDPGDGGAHLAVARPADGVFEIFVWDGERFLSQQLLYPTGSQPSALAAGDLNGDGIDDLVLADSADGVIRVYLGTGFGEFAAAGSFPAGQNPVALLLADFNGDGALDLAVANAGDNTVSVLLNDGAGRFVPAATLPAGQGPAALAAPDLDGDGNLDLAIANSAAGSVSLFRGDGTGHFTPAGAWLTGRNPVSVALADLNGDGVADLVTANNGSQDLSLLLVRH